MKVFEELHSISIADFRIKNKPLLGFTKLGNLVPALGKSVKYKSCILIMNEKLTEQSHVIEIFCQLNQFTIDVLIRTACFKYLLLQ